MFYQRSRGEHPVRQEAGVCHGDDLMFIFPMETFPSAVDTAVCIMYINPNISETLKTQTFAGSEENARKTLGYNTEFCQQGKTNNVWAWRYLETDGAKEI